MMTHRPPFSPFSLYSSRVGKNLKQPLSVMMCHGGPKGTHGPCLRGDHSLHPVFPSSMASSTPSASGTTTSLLNRHRETETLEPLHFQRKVSEADFEAFHLEKQTLGFTDRRSKMKTPINTMGNDCGSRPCSHVL